MPPKPKPLDERFRPKVRKTETCWVWTGRPNHYGYGQINSGGKNGEPLLAHRLSYEWTYGPIPDALCVLHRCDNRLCVRPDHLFLGTRPDNSRDMVSKGRRGRGEDSPGAKLTWAQAAEIRERYAQGGVSYAALGRLYRCDFGKIGRIIRGESWVPHSAPSPSRAPIVTSPPPGM